MRPRLRKAAIAAAVAAGLLLVFGAYFNPHLAVQMANTLWACF